MLWGPSRVVAALVILTSLFAVRSAQADELPANRSTFITAENTVYGTITQSSEPVLSGPILEPQFSHSEVLALQSPNLTFTSRSSAKDNLPDPSERVPEPRSLALFGSGLILMALILRAQNAQPRAALRLHRRRSLVADDCLKPIMASPAVAAFLSNS